MTDDAASMSPVGAQGPDAVGALLVVPGEMAARIDRLPHYRQYLFLLAGLQLLLLPLIAWRLPESPRWLDFPTRMRGLGTGWSDGLGHIGAWGGSIISGAIFLATDPLG